MLIGPETCMVKLLFFQELLKCLHGKDYIFTSEKLDTLGSFKNITAFVNFETSVKEEADMTL